MSENDEREFRVVCSRNVPFETQTDEAVKKQKHLDALIVSESLQHNKCDEILKHCSNFKLFVNVLVY